MQPEASAEGLTDLYFHEALYFAAVTITTVGYGKQHHVAVCWQPTGLPGWIHAHTQLGFSYSCCSWLSKQHGFYERWWRWQPSCMAAAPV